MQLATTSYADDVKQTEIVEEREVMETIEEGGQAFDRVMNKKGLCQSCEKKEVLITMVGEGSAASTKGKRNTERRTDKTYDVYAAIDC